MTDLQCAKFKESVVDDAEDVFAPRVGEEYLDGERLVDSTSFLNDGVDSRRVDAAVVESFECFDDESGWVVLDGD